MTSKDRSTLISLSQSVREFIGAPASELYTIPSVMHGKRKSICENIVGARCYLLLSLPRFNIILLGGDVALKVHVFKQNAFHKVDHCTRYMNYACTTKVQGCLRLLLLEGRCIPTHSFISI